MLIMDVYIFGINFSVQEQILFMALSTFAFL